ncbi:MAG: SMP-30/gluconolactonase/LRE family protein, partial [Saprospiraceae bacterium]|nr:SMP-30/gluconolactonase/LRE family protein [Saprospiraceae bacterium]
MNQQNIPRKKMSWLLLLLSMTPILALAQSGQGPAYTHVFSISSESEGEVFLQDPCGSAVDHNGFVYISDHHQHKILKFDRDGALVMQWGVPGTAEGQFDQPGGVAVGSDGNLFVLDIGNYRVQKFTPEGEFILSFGSQGTQNGQFFDPLAIMADHSGNIYVSDGGLGAKIQRFNLLGGFVDKFGTPFLIEGDLSTPKGLAFSADGTILVADSARSAVFEYNLAGTLINSVTLFETDAGSSSFVAPVGITVDRNGRIYVLDRLIGTNRIYYFDRDFLFQGIYFNNGSGSNQLDTPKSITTDTISNRVYVTDAGRGKLLRFTTNLDPVLEVGTNTLSGSRQLSTPGGVGLSGDLIYISDSDNKEIKTYFTTNFRYTGLSYRGPVSGPGALQSPGPLGVTSQGVLFVIDNQTDIKKFRRDGTFENANNASQNQRFNGIHVDPDGNHLITQITPLSNPMAGFREYGPDFSIRNASSTFDFLSPMGITRDKTGFVYVSDTSQNTVRAYNPMNGFGFSKSFEAPKVAPFFFSGPSSLAIDHRGNILIADSGNHRILKYDNNGKFITSFGSYGSMAGQFFHPIDIKADETGQIYVVERGNRRVQVFQTCQIIHTEERTICAGDSTLFEGIYYTTTGQFDRTFISQSGCDSTNRLELTVMDPIQTVMDTTICAGESINFFESTLQITGTYQAILSAQNGCDSVVSLNLTVAENYQIDAEVHICEGESLPFGDQILTQAGQYSNIFTSQQGCDSTVHLNLIISDTIFSQQTDTICIGDTLRIGDQFFTQPTSGRVTFPATAERCDSVVAFTLHVLNTFQTFRQDTICNGDNLRIGDAILNQSGTYEVVFPPTDKRCDSTVVVELTVLDRFISVRNDVICRGDTLKVDDFMFTDSGTYNINFPATSSRCDSSITINLTVLENYYTLRRDTICQGEYVRIDTINFPPNGLRCDSIVELRLTVLDTFQTYRSDTLCAGESLTINDQILVTTGEYVINFPPTQDRCDSVVTVNLTVLPTFQTARFDT